MLLKDVTTEKVGIADPQDLRKTLQTQICCVESVGCQAVDAGLLKRRPCLLVCEASLQLLEVVLKIFAHYQTSLIVTLPARGVDNLARCNLLDLDNKGFDNGHKFGCMPKEQGVSLDLAWKGSLAKLVSDRTWRRMMNIRDGRVLKTQRYLSEIRDEQKVLVDAALRASLGRISDSKSNIYVRADELTRLRAEFRNSGFSITKFDAVGNANIERATWLVASKAAVGHRKDLLDAFGVRIFVTAEGINPVDAAPQETVGPIDVVYTWVDGSDREWLRSRDTYSESETSAYLKTAAEEARFISNDEIRFSLRSIEAFMPWINHIYIVTSGQVPKWLDVNNDRISIVPHEEIFANPKNLPTFNSHAIESQIHRIEGLSEHFLYMNDDFFVGRTLTEDDFFDTDGSTKFVLSDRTYESDLSTGLPINIAAANNDQLLMNEFGMTASRKFKHVAHPQRKSLLTRIEQKHASEVAATAAARFRSSSDFSIPSSLAHYYGQALGQAKPTEVSYEYVDMGSEDAQLKLAKLSWSARPQMFCLNQVSGEGSNLVSQNAALNHFLQLAFPWKSSFEI